MKTKTSLLAFFATGCALMVASQVNAANYYWDIDDATPGAGGVSPAGIWGTGGLTWSSDPLGSSSVLPVTTTAADDLFFSAGTYGFGAFNVTLSDAQVANSLTFEEGNVTIRGAGGSISLEGIDCSVQVTNGAIATIGSNTNLIMSGTLGLTKLGVGSLTLSNSAANTVTGGVRVKGGTLLLNFQNLATPTDLLDSTNALELGGGILSITGKATGTTSQTVNNITVNAGGGAILGNRNGGTALNISLGSITATTTGSSLLLGGPTGSLPVMTTGSTNDATGILGSRTVYFNGVASTGYDFAVSNSGTLGGYAGYTAFAASGTDAATNYRLQTAAITGVTNQSVNTLKIIGVNLTQTSGTTLTFEGGGLLTASTAGSTIAGGSLTAGNGSGSYDLHVLVGGIGGGQTTINSNIVDNGVNSVNLVKSGPGTLILGTASKSYTGSTYVNAGILEFAGFAPAGTGRNVFVAPGALVKFASPTTALMSRIAQTNEEIGILTASGSAAAIDFSAAGADLPNAFLAGGWASNGAKNDNFTGTITPANNTYRIGFPGAAGTFGLSTILDGANNGLIVGGAIVCLTSANTFGGETRIRTGGNLLLANSLALQNSPLNLGSGSDTLAGKFALSNRQTNLVNDKTVTNATLGGLIGSQNLSSAYGGAYGNNASTITTNAITGFTLNTASGASHSYTGAIINFARDMVLTKSGVGSQLLGGSNAYSGVTTVSEGTLKISHANALGRGGSAGASSGSTVVNTGGTLDLNGTVGVVEPIVINGPGVGGVGALVNNSGSPATLLNRLASLQITNGGTYSAATTATIAGTGAGATATVQMGLSNASITSISGGTAWEVGDLFTPTGGGGSGAIFQVTSVSTGAITGYNIVNAGTGYTSAPTAITRVNKSASGVTGVVVSFNATNFAVAGLTLTNPGTGYDNTTSITFGSGDATAIAQYSSVTLASDSSIGGTSDIELEAGIAETDGSFGLNKVGAAILKLYGINTYTGNTTVSTGTLELADDAQLKFVLGSTSGVNNSITGLGTVILNGDFTIDTTAADTLTSGTWTLENVDSLTGAYGATFSVIGFTDAGSNLWTKSLPGKKYTFDETSGILTLALTEGDGVPPTLTSIVDNTAGGLVNINTPVAYTVTFDEDMNDTTVTVSDFGNNGTAAVTIDSVTETSLNSGVFTVIVTPTGPGTLILRINEDAILQDASPNANVLNTDAALLDGTTIIVRNAYQTWALSNAIGSAPDQDKDGDGVNNAVEFLLGGDVNTNDLGNLPKVTVTATNMIITFERKRSSADGVTGCEIEIGTTLTSWSDGFTVGATTGTSEAGVTVAENSPTVDVDTITLTVPKGIDPKKFARLSVHVTP